MNELIGLVQVVRHWRPYLWGRSFVVRTDHYSLKFLLDQRLATIPQHHWVSKLLGFDFFVEYRPGRLNTVADALSRRDEDINVSFALSAPHFSLLDAVRKAASSEPALVALHDQITAGELGAPWELVDGLVPFNRRIYIPSDSTILWDVLVAAHDVAHEGVKKTMHRLRYDFHTP